MPFYLNTYRPLAISEHGQSASAKFGIPPFVDGSIRREPDFEHFRPSITCICRGEKFAPRLNAGDVVGYMTVKHAYDSAASAHHRLTGILLVTHKFDAHVAAAAWYRRQKWFKENDPQYGIPSNCMIPGNPPRPLEESSRGPCDPDISIDDWDQHYEKRAAVNGSFLVCDKKFCDLSWSAPIVFEDDLVSAFGKNPGTRNPGRKSIRHFVILLEILRTKGNKLYFEL